MRCCSFPLWPPHTYEFHHSGAILVSIKLISVKHVYDSRSYGMVVFLHLQDVIAQPIGLVHYLGIKEELYVACSSGTTGLPG